MEELWHCADGPEDKLSGEINLEMELRLRRLVERRLSGTPLAYLVGHQTFMGIDFLSSPDVMIPRKETEILAQAAMVLARQLITDSKPIKIMDLCTGSGNIALTLAYKLPECEVVGADLSEDAVLLARRNAHHLGLADQARFYQGDLFAPFENGLFLGQMDLIIL